MCGKKMETHGLVKKIERYRLSSSNELTVLVSWANNRIMKRLKICRSKSLSNELTVFVSWANNRNYEEIKNLQEQIVVLNETLNSHLTLIRMNNGMIQTTIFILVITIYKFIFK